LQRIVVAVDPPASSGGRAAACGIVAAGITDGGICYVIADDTVSGVTPNAWAMKAIALWHRLRADVLVAEVNQGGEMVRSVINQVDSSVPVTSVHASRAKWLRAEPVATLYEQGRVKHAGIFAALEDEMCDFGVSGLSSGKSPDRAGRAGLGDRRAGVSGARRTADQGAVTIVSRARRSAQRCFAEPGPYRTPPLVRPRLCGAPLRATLRPGAR
jgi:hypothetical protein